ncbi:MAG TPA: cbb3-type cytochrome c oxidase N-terminal domain-containing protein [Kiritimatiellia bacterium]|nr:cbb3-type cytochrome c oxidase N-terminal domain-containing protein [Kiritimatiellia bacterium]
MSANPENEHAMTDHEYDGIKELDNNLPQWWVWLFIITVVWSLGYMVYFHVLGGPGQIDEYRAEMAAAGKPVQDTVMAATTATAPVDAPPSMAIPDEPDLDEKTLALGRDIYIKNCLVCHAPDGGGLIGPNFTDDYYIHGGSYADSVNVIIQGVPAKGMIPWQGVLKPEEIHAVASYIWTMRGTTPANPKAPEGVKVQM